MSPHVTLLYSRQLLGLLVCLCMSGMHLQVFGQTVESAPEIKTGDKWEYQFHNIFENKEPYTYTAEVQQIIDGVAWLYHETNNPSSIVRQYYLSYDIKHAKLQGRFPFSALTESKRGPMIRDYSKNDAVIRFPMHIGDTYTVNEIFGTSTYKWDARVSAFEPVVTQAGKFDAFRIELDGTRLFPGLRNPVRASKTVWYAPNVKREIKVEFKNRDSRGGLSNHTLTELTYWRPAQ